MIARPGRDIFRRALRHDPAAFGIVSAAVALGWCAIATTQPGAFESYRGYSVIRGVPQGVWGVCMGLGGCVQMLVVVFGSLRKRRISAATCCFFWTFISVLFVIAQWPTLNTAVSTYFVIALTQFWSLWPLAYAAR